MSIIFLFFLYLFISRLEKKTIRAYIFYYSYVPIVPIKLRYCSSYSRDYVIDILLNVSTTIITYRLTLYNNT